MRSFKGALEVKVLFDTSASFTVIGRGVAEKIGFILPTDVREVTLADGKSKLKVMLTPENHQLPEPTIFTKLLS